MKLMGYPLFLNTPFFLVQPVAETPDRSFLRMERKGCRLDADEWWLVAVYGADRFGAQRTCEMTYDRGPGINRINRIRSKK